MYLFNPLTVKMHDMKTRSCTKSESETTSEWKL